jgi:hypothetical protein
MPINTQGDVEMQVTERCIREWTHFEARDQDHEVVYEVYEAVTGGWVAYINLFRKSSDGLTIYDVVRGFANADEARQHAISALRKTRRFELADFILAH